MTNGEHRSEEILEEYKALRAEILMQIDHHRREYLILLPVMGTILTYAFTSKQPVFCLLAFFINLYSWRHHRSVWSTVIKLGAYIAVFIEPETKGSQYEGMMSRAGHKREPFLPFLDRLLKIIPTYYAIISLCSILLGLYLYFTELDFKYYLILFAIILIGHLLIIYYMNKHGTIKEAEYWRKLFKQVKEEKA